MNEKALKTLEFDKTIKMLEGKAVSPMGKAMAGELLPSVFLADIRLWQQETGEAAAFILRKGSIPLGGVKDIGASLKRAEIGGMLSIDELIGVGDFIYVCRKLKNYSKFEGKGESFPLLDPLFEGIGLTPELESEIARCIIGENEVADNASSKLADIRRNLRVSNARVSEQLNSVIQSSAYKNMLQDAVITMRGGRFCVPVKHEYRNSFPGMIHDQSSSGATLFIEPMSVVNLNNKIKELAAEEKAEIDAILMRLSGMVASCSGILTANVEMITKLDFIFAKGELSLAMRGTEPVFNTSGVVEIRKARHPLLDPDKVVPTDIYIGEGFTTLLITGPNTGGKTVSLKTIGLFCLMGQAGLHIPAFDNSRLAVFGNVFADIGDEQSIEQSLSTFSSHMSNIVKILEDVSDNSLVLLDELGAGTDPTEGAALAVAIIDYLKNRGIRTVVTTHYSELKVYALSTQGVENAACEFDVETLRPTYRLLIGIPGKSNAFAISRRLGLPEHIISSAKEVLSSEDERFEDIITDLEISKKTVIMEREQAERLRKEVESLKKTYESQKEKLNAQRDKILLEARNEARVVLEAAKTESDGIIKDMQRMLQENVTYKELEEKRQRLREGIHHIDKEMGDLSGPRKDIRPLEQPLKVGDKVFIHSLSQSGKVLTLPDPAGNVHIQAGNIRVKSNVSDLSLDETKEAPEKPKYRNIATVKKDKSLLISPKIDLRGNMVEEALEKTDKYLDDASLSGLSKVEIIHGKGTGALRSAIQEHLKRHPHVKSYRLGVFGEGEDGVTIVELKS